MVLYFCKEISNRCDDIRKMSIVIREIWDDILEQEVSMNKIKEDLPCKITYNDKYEEIREMIDDHLPKDLTNLVALYGDEPLNRPYIYGNACISVDNRFYTEIREYSDKESDILQKHACNAGVCHPEQSFFEVQYTVRRTSCHIRWLVEANMEIIAMNRVIGRCTPVGLVYFNKCFAPSFFITKLTFYDREVPYLCVNLLDSLKGYMKKIEGKVDQMTKVELLRHLRKMMIYNNMTDETLYTSAVDSYDEFSDLFFKIKYK